MLFLTDVSTNINNEIVENINKKKNLISINIKETFIRIKIQCTLVIIN